ARLKAYSWPGNVRELRNVMDRAVLLARGATIQPGDLQLSDATSPGQAAASGGGGQGEGYPPTLSLAQVEAAHIAAVLRETRGHMGEASQILGIHRNTLTRKLREYNLQTDTKDAPDQ
ncbi:MAG: sigma-54-dependent Fis family transcriptional regulator, partial [Gemmatimonadetes bacterium]|nr:sigma-54-dependent Fis family transcriptional regulator [Gemmatimonadota bacterium]